MPNLTIMFSTGDGFHRVAVRFQNLEDMEAWNKGGELGRIRDRMLNPNFYAAFRLNTASAQTLALACHVGPALNWLDLSASNCNTKSLTRSGRRTSRRNRSRVKFPCRARWRKRASGLSPTRSA